MHATSPCALFRHLITARVDLALMHKRVGMIFIIAVLVATALTNAIAVIDLIMILLLVRQQALIGSAVEGNVEGAVGSAMGYDYWGRSGYYPGARGTSVNAIPTGASAAR